jgi:glycosyltransferase involved in cell wall biosynthesis
MDDVGLVLKASRGSAIPASMERLRQSIAGLPAWLIDTFLEQGDVHALTACCDCTISLHRSEGFGLTLAEAMYLGKPVIATGYSGNMDFTKVDTSFLVNYNLTRIRETVGPYHAGAEWAEPDIGHAAEQMRRVVDARAVREAVTRRGQEFIRYHHSPQAVGAAIRQRIKLILDDAHRRGLRADMRPAPGPPGPAA